MKLHLAIALLAFPLLVHGGIEFESTTLKVDAPAGADQADFVFKFKVTGEKPVQIKDMKVSCGCLEATTAHSEYGPGSTGEIKITLTIGSVEGEMQKPTTVFTNDPKNPSIQLDSIVNVQKIFEFTPMSTSWEVGDEPKPKTVRIKILGPDPIKILKYSSTRENVEAEMKEVLAGREYELQLTPKSTAQPELGLISMETDCKIAKFGKRQIFFTIVRKTNTRR